MKEDITLHINGREHKDWLSYQIISDLMQPSNTWNVALGIPMAKTPDGLQPWAPVTISIGGEQVLSGRIDTPVRTIHKGKRSLSISGRDMAAVLCDCSAPVWTTLEADLETIVETLVKPMGIPKVRIEAKGGHEKIIVTPGTTAWTALRQVCELNGCWPWMDPDGTLVIGGPDYTQEPVAELRVEEKEKNANVISLSVKRSVSGWYSEVSILGQTHGRYGNSGDHSLMGSAKDSLLGDSDAYRPKIIVDGDCDSKESAQKKANSLQADARLNSLTINATVRGHRAPGKNGPGPLWEPGQMVRVVCVQDGLDDAYFLMGRTFVGGIGGQTTELTLKPADAWLPDLARRDAKQTGRRQKRQQKEAKTL